LVFFYFYFFFFSLLFVNIHLADYGESRLLAGGVEGTVTGGIGTYAYMAPELLSGEERFV
jgi:serine/threonine protein kinase